MHFPNVPSIPPEDYAQKIAKKVRESVPGQYFVKTSQDDIGSGEVSHVKVASVYRRRSFWFPKCVATVSNRVPYGGGPGTIDVKIYENGVDSGKLEVIVDNMRSMCPE